MKLLRQQTIIILRKPKQQFEHLKHPPKSKEEMSGIFYKLIELLSLVLESLMSILGVV